MGVILLEISLQDHMELFNKANIFMLYNGMRITRLEPDRATVELDIVPESLNLRGAVHGGVYFTMSDCAASAAARTDGRAYVTLDADIHFLRGATQGHLIAQAVVRRRGRSICRVDVSVTDEKGQLLCDAGYSMFCTGPAPAFAPAAQQ